MITIRDIRGAVLVECEGLAFRDGTLQGAHLKGAHLQGADLRDAYLHRGDVPTLTQEEGTALDND